MKVSLIELNSTPVRVVISAVHMYSKFIYFLVAVRIAHARIRGSLDISLTS